MISYINMKQVVRLKDGRKIMLDTEAKKFRTNKQDAPNGTFDFVQRKADMNKGLFYFRNSLLKNKNF